MLQYLCWCHQRALMEQGDVAVAQIPQPRAALCGGRCQALAGSTRAAASTCATRGRDLLEATEYSTDPTESWQLVKPHPARCQYFPAEQISLNTHPFPFP